MTVWIEAGEAVFIMNAKIYLRKIGHNNVLLFLTFRLALPR